MPAIRSELEKTWGGVFDDETILTVFKLMKKGFLDEIIGIEKEGKESVVVRGIKDEKLMAVKIYLTKASNFKRMGIYLEGDERFKKIKKNKRSIIFAWCKKEYKNLIRAQRAGVNCPNPLAFLKNVLVMEFISGGDGLGAPRLKDAKIENPKHVFEEIVADLKRLYREAGLVHGDLSEFNILFNGKPVIIDFSQAVLRDHANAEEFLKRDIKNICKFFEKKGVPCSEIEVYKSITGGIDND